ncbi:AraC family transcriptional regulator [Spirosoma harenae]
MHLTLTLDAQKTQVQALAEQLSSPLTAPDRLDCPAHVGNGYVQAYYFPLGLTVNVYQLRLSQSISFETINPANSGVYCLFINLSEEGVEKTIDGETFAINQQSPNGIFYYAPANQIRQQNAQNRLLRFVAITFTEATFEQLVSLEQRAKLVPSFGSFMFLDMDLPMQSQLQQLFTSPTASESELNKLTKYTLTLDVWTAILNKVLQRQSAADTRGMFEQDIQKLFTVRNYLLTHLNETVLQTDLAAMVGFSESKLKRLFPRLFGRSVYQYQLVARMERARQLLTSRQFSVSEVGYQVGYTNMTHFAEAFQKHFALKPRDFLRTIKNKRFSQPESVSN